MKNIIQNAVNIEFKNEISIEQATEALKNTPGIIVADKREDAIYVSRIRKDNSIKNGLSIWITADNLRKGAALNTIQIAEELQKFL